MSHILIVGGGPAGISAALRLAERGQRVTLASAKPPIYHRCTALPGIDLPEDAAAELRAMGAQSLSGHEIMHALNRKLLRYEAEGSLRLCAYHRLLRLAMAGGHCAGGVLLNELTGRLEGVTADAVLLATGGMHTMFQKNRFGNDGLAAALAFQAGAALRNPDQINRSGRFPIFEGGLVTSWDGETTVPGLYAAGECADSTAIAFPFAQALATGTAAADALSEAAPQAADPLEAGCAVTEAVGNLQQRIDLFRKTRGTRAPAAVERRIRETVQRTMTGRRTARLLQRGLLDIRVMRQQAGRGEYDLGEGLYPVLRLPSLLYLLEILLTTAAYRLLRQDGDLTVALRGGKIDVTAKRSAAAEAAAFIDDVAEEALSALPEDRSANAARNELIGVGSALQNAAENEFAAKYQRSKPPEAEAGEADTLPPPLESLAPSGDTIAFQPVRVPEPSAGAGCAPVLPEEPVSAAAAPSETELSALAFEGEPAPDAAPRQPSVPETAAGPAVPPEAAEPLVPDERTENAAETVPEAAPAGSAEPSGPVPVPAAEPAPETPEDGFDFDALLSSVSGLLAAQAPAGPEETTSAPVVPPDLPFLPEAPISAPDEPASEPVAAAEAILDPTPGGTVAEPNAPQERTVFSTETILDPSAPTPPENETAAPEKRASEPFFPDPEALLALAKARKAEAETAASARPAAPAQERPPEPRRDAPAARSCAGRYSTFDPDPEALLALPRSESSDG